MTYRNSQVTMGAISKDQKYLKTGTDATTVAITVDAARNESCHLDAGVPTPGWRSS